VFTVKHNPEEKVDRLKVRLAAKGYTQTYGIDYEETFAPMAKNKYGTYPHLMCGEFRLEYTPIRCEEYFPPWGLKGESVHGTTS
jgi:hypothetical protein